MFGIFSLIILLHTIGYKLFSKKAHGIISCGLFAYIATPEHSTFSWDKFNFLGVDNDERGGTSIGRLVGNNIEKYINPKKANTNYKDYVINCKNSEPSHIALGHTRRASNGAKTEEFAQPIIFNLPDNQGIFAMIHNGTIYNWEDLAKEYEVESTGKNDSQVLAEIIMKHGYDVLVKYRGAATIIIRDDRYEDTLFVYKGMSKNYSDKLEEERPLYMWQESEHSIYLSSREEGLYFIGGDADNVFDIECNILFSIKGGEISKVADYDRSNSSQSSVIKYNNNNTWNYNNYKKRSYYDDDYNYEDAYGYGSYASQNKIFSDDLIQHESMLVANPVRDKIYFFRLRYWVYDGNDFKIINGMRHITAYGQIRPIASNIMPVTNVYYFYKGIMMYDKNGYDITVRKYGKAKYFLENATNCREISLYSMYPVTVVNKDMKNSCTYHDRVKTTNSTYFYSGTVYALFSNQKYTFSHGDLTQKKEVDKYNFPTHILPVINTQKFLPATVENKTKETTIIVEDDEEEENQIISDAINEAVKMMIEAGDKAREELEVLGLDDKCIKTFLNNISALTEPLYDADNLKKSKIKIESKDDN